MPRSKYGILAADYSYLCDLDAVDEGCYAFTSLRAGTALKHLEERSVYYSTDTGRYVTYSDLSTIPMRGDVFLMLAEQRRVFIPAMYFGNISFCSELQALAHALGED